MNICQNTKKAVFCGTLTAGKLRTTVEQGTVKIEQEGKFQKLVDQVQEVTFSGSEAIKRGQEVLYITERAVFRLTKQGVELCEVAPGLDVEKDVIAHMGFRPVLAKDLKEMDARLFQAGEMGLREEAPWKSK